jgi:hypothetical protein
MEYANVAKQMITFQKTLFENSFRAMTTVQDQTEQMMMSFLDKMPWVNEEGKKSIDEQVKYYKKIREDFKKAVDDGYAKMEEMISAK